MTGKQALDNIAIKFDENGYEPSNLDVEPHRHFSDIFKFEMEIIEKELDRLEKIARGDIIEPFDNLKDLIEFLKYNDISYEQIGDYGNILVIYHVGEYRVRCFFSPRWDDRTRRLDYIKNNLDYIKIDKE